MRRLLPSTLWVERRRGPGSVARRKLLESLEEVDYLQSLFYDETGDGPGRRPPKVEVLHKSCIMLTCSYWEAYCEDVVEEALKLIVDNVKKPTDLPEELLKMIAGTVKADKNDVAVWGLAGDGWKAIVTANLQRIKEQRNWDFNTPKHTKVDDLFKDGIGLTELSSHWKYNKYTAEESRKTLDQMVTLRGQIAHRGRHERAVVKDDVDKFTNIVLRISELTDKAVNVHVKKTIGRPLFSADDSQLMLDLDI